MTGSHRRVHLDCITVSCRLCDDCIDAVAALLKQLQANQGVEVQVCTAAC
jgi:hypothetical protein